MGACKGKIEFFFVSKNGSGPRTWAQGFGFFPSLRSIRGLPLFTPFKHAAQNPNRDLESLFQTRQLKVDLRLFVHTRHHLRQTGRRQPLNQDATSGPIAATDPTGCRAKLLLSLSSPLLRARERNSRLSTPRRRHPR
ncbi:hypothetical protein VIGAN_07007800 [Vigna angularis var. angularis]|uniref:Uncharacterized protein n=1 Tax=Vigna angularis var. angularis TaxID=157739 RepID=A0A0S3SF86_PHAAN|nr:hypothetical protein VIGAN_07007800 [Vigna angularis var. angularis]